MGSTLMPPPPAATDAEKRTRERANAMVMLSTMFALSDDQLALVMTAAGSLPVGKRGVFLERVAVRPQLRGPHFTDADLGAAIQVAVTGLIQSAV